ncbi:uncharacterized protein LOC111894702 [Lactuca sativa]|uniref:uncharacterized protein LOC111894702 n=1 Tax=Lactuca sativa TaxID=4236 RepID=UPI001C68A2C9|nr:uncharacterized protein LOC111894702 [Lactuca sativa]
MPKRRVPYTLILTYELTSSKSVDCVNRYILKVQDALEVCEYHLWAHDDARSSAQKILSTINNLKARCQWKLRLTLANQLETV